MISAVGKYVIWFLSMTILVGFLLHMTWLIFVALIVGAVYGLWSMT